MTTLKRQKRFGACQEDWTNLCNAGLAEDLLPVVSDPNIPISPLSKMKSTGKTPSMLNRQGEVVGLVKWTQELASVKQIQFWATHPAYGVCVQTRKLRAFDIDIDDKATAGRILRELVERIDPFGLGAHYRYREGTGKCLLPVFVVLPEEHRTISKRIIKTDSGVVEVLADGQQFVAAGTHTSGTRYLWSTDDGFCPDHFPSLSEEDFEAICGWLVREYGTENMVSILSSGRSVTRAAGLGPVDPVAEHLEAEGWLLSESMDGRMNITCPFKHEHTSDSGETETQYFPAGVGETGGVTFQRGHFKCLHAHCANRSDGDFLEAIRYGLGDFEDLGLRDADKEKKGLVVDLPPAPELDEMPRLKLNKGTPVIDLQNIIRAVGSRAYIGRMLAHDAFTGRAVTATTWTAHPDWVNFSDIHYGRVAETLAQKGWPIKRISDVHDAVDRVIDRTEVDTLTAWVNSLRWDGVPRVAGFVNRVWDIQQHQERGESVSLYMWTALAGRALNPGIEADSAIVLQGAQGVGKTRSLKALVPSRDWYIEVDLNNSDVEVQRSLQGRVVYELGELAGMRKKERSRTKALISATKDTIRPLYQSNPVDIPRRGVWFGSTNEDDFLDDDTGNRRFLVLKVGPRCDVDYVVQYRDQLWAEAAVLYRERGVVWQEVNDDAAALTEEVALTPEMSEAVARWLALEEEIGVTNGDREFQTHEALLGIGLPAFKAVERVTQLKAAKALRWLGYKKVTIWRNGRSCKGWRAGDTTSRYLNGGDLL